MRIDGRATDKLRDFHFNLHPSEYAEGSVLIEIGKTKVLCTASLDANLPKWLQGSGKGWVTAEYGMLPRSTQTRVRRDKAMSCGRTHEISRLIGRSLRAGIDLKVLGERQIIVDCDVLQADGGTRTAAINGGFVALALALKRLYDVQELTTIPLKHYVTAISVGLQKDNSPLLDLSYDEDATIATDMNFVLTEKEGIVEIQGTAEHEPFYPQHFEQMLKLAQKGCEEIRQVQQKIISSFFNL